MFGYSFLTIILKLRAIFYDLHEHIVEHSDRVGFHVENLQFRQRKDLVQGYVSQAVVTQVQISQILRRIKDIRF